MSRQRRRDGLHDPAVAQAAGVAEGQEDAGSDVVGSRNASTICLFLLRTSSSKTGIFGSACGGLWLEAVRGDGDVLEVGNDEFQNAR